MKKINLKGVMAAGMSVLMGLSLCACGSSANAGAGQSTASGTQAAAGDAAAGDLPKITMSIGHNNSTDSLMNFAAEHMKEELETKSNGNITVNIYPNGQLGSESDMITSCQEGDLTFLITGLHALVNNVPAASIINIPFQFDNVEQARQVYNDQTVRDLLNAEFEKSNMELVLLTDQGFRCLTTNKEITGPDSLSGLNIRTLTNEDQVAAWKMLGANPTPIDFSELYLSLQQGVIDSQENPYDIIDSNKFYEVQKYLTNSNHIYHTISVTMGTGTYNGLPDAYKTMLDEVCRDVEQLTYDECDKMLDTYKEDLTGNGMQFVDFDAIDGMRDSLKEKTSGMIDVVKKTVNNDQLMDAYLSAVDKAKTAQ